MTPEEIFERLRPELGVVLRLPEEEIHPHSSFFGDLNAESIDIAELQVILEEVFGVETSDETIEAYVMGPLTEQEFYDEEHVVTPVGLERLTAVVANFDPTCWSGELTMFNLWRVLTVQSLCQYVSDSLQTRPAGASFSA